MSDGQLFSLSGYLLGALVWGLAARRRGTATTGMAWLLLAGLSGGLIGAVALQTAVVGLPAGKSLLGGLAGGFVAVELTKRYLGITRSTGDLFALALPAGEFLGRLGCYCNGCCYGTVSTVPWAVHQHGAWRHPAQLYASATAALIFLTLTHIRPRREGDLFRWFLVLYGSARLVLEHFREGLDWGGLSPAQWVCLAMIAWGLAGLRSGLSKQDERE